MTVDQVLGALRAGRGKLRCADVKHLLIQLGFDVRDGKKGGHKLFFHDQLREFHSGSYNCGHGKNPEIKPAYINKIVGILENHKAELNNLGN